MEILFHNAMCEGGYYSVYCIYLICSLFTDTYTYIAPRVSWVIMWGFSIYESRYLDYLVFRYETSCRYLSSSYVLVAGQSKEN